MELGSRLGLGTAPLGSLRSGPLWWSHQGRDVSVATVRAALDAGITWIDTAPFYGWGQAESVVGEAVRGRRDEVTILTKCGTVRRPNDTWVTDASPSAIRADIVESLRRLGVEHVDVLQLHDPDPRVPIEVSVESIAGLVSAGTVGHVGLSNHPVELLRRAHSVTPISVVQDQWSILHHPPETQAVRDWCADSDVRFLAWAPLASGFLTDDFDLEATDPLDLRRSLPWATGQGASKLESVRCRSRRAGPFTARPRSHLGIGDRTSNRRGPHTRRSTKPLRSTIPLTPPVGSGRRSAWVRSLLWITHRRRVAMSP